MFYCRLNYVFEVNKERSIELQKNIKYIKANKNI